MGVEKRFSMPAEGVSGLGDDSGRAGPMAEASLLFRVMSFIHSTIEMEQIAAVILSCVTAGHALGFNRAFLFLVDDDNNVIRGMMGIGPSSGEEAKEIWERLHDDGFSLEDIIGIARADSGACVQNDLSRRVRSIVVPLTKQDSVLVRTIREKEVFVFPEEGGTKEDLSEFGPLRTDAFALAPVVAKRRVLGAILADNRYTGGEITSEQVYLLAALASQAGMAVENARMFSEAKRKLAELSTLHEVSKSILSTTDLGEELSLIARISAQVLDANGSILHLIEKGEDGGEDLRVGAAFGIGETLLATRMSGLATRAASEVIRLRRPLLVKDLASDGRFSDMGVEEVSSLLCVPLSALEETIGGITVFDKRPVPPFNSKAFDRDDMRFLSVLGDQAAIAIQNARLFRAARVSERRRREAEALAMRVEKLALLGEVTSNVAHEIRNPLSSIGGVARLVRRSIEPDDERSKWMEVIIRETDRLERMLHEHLSLALHTRLTLAMSNINVILEEILQLTVAEVREKGLSVRLHLAGNLPELSLDRDKIKQVVLNLVRNAIDNTPKGGKIRVESRRSRHGVVFLVNNEGPPIRRDMLERLFVPFATSKQAGSGLGLAIVHQIVKQHGGTIDVSSAEETGTTFAVTLPQCPPEGG
ncbi:MAG: GAF domain-containing protein [Candidatus Eisenbacteria sp.]|nr:GAF domain-containing protein [Candidatus Eisenbacteria bacterium]